MRADSERERERSSERATKCSKDTMSQVYLECLQSIWLRMKMERARDAGCVSAHIFSILFWRAHNILFSSFSCRCFPCEAWKVGIVAVENHTDFVKSQCGEKRTHSRTHTHAHSEARRWTKTIAMKMWINLYYNRVISSERGQKCGEQHGAHRRRKKEVVVVNGGWRVAGGGGVR